MNDAQEAARRRAHVRREMMVSAVINAVIGVVMSWVVFGWQAVETREVALSFFPQTAPITLVGGLIPSLITLALVARGRIVPAGPVPTKAGQLARILCCMALAVPVLGGSGALLLSAVAPPVLQPVPMIAVNALYGAVVGIVTTPPIIRMALGMRAWPRRAAVAPLGTA